MKKLVAINCPNCGNRHDISDIEIRGCYRHIFICPSMGPIDPPIVLDHKALGLEDMFIWEGEDE